MQIHQILPAVLVPILPLLVDGLSAEEPRRRVAALDLLGRLFSVPEARVISTGMPELFLDFLKRAVDLEVSSHLAKTQMVATWQVFGLTESRWVAADLIAVNRGSGEEEQKSGMRREILAGKRQAGLSAACPERCWACRPKVSKIGEALPSSPPEKVRLICCCCHTFGSGKP